MPTGKKKKAMAGKKKKAGTKREGDPRKMKKEKNKEDPNKKTERPGVDKTFGIKNKGGRSNSQYVSNMNKNQKQARGKGDKARAKQEKLNKEAASGKGPAIIDGEAAKTQLCNFFRMGKCTKGGRCKFSHDLNIVAKVKAAKAEEQRAKMQKTMEDMTKFEVEEAIRQNMRAMDMQISTDIVCDHFLDALEKKLYGYRWVCPNGGYNCKYRHALPKGWILHIDDDDREEIVRESLEETLENMRREFSNRTDLTPVTEVTFAAWKAKRAAEKQNEKQQDILDKLAKARKLTRVERQMMGRKLFERDPNFQDPNAADAKEEVAKPKTFKPAPEEPAFDESLFGVDDEDLFAEEEDVAGTGDKKATGGGTTKKEESKPSSAPKKKSKDDLEFDESLFCDDF